MWLGVPAYSAFYCRSAWRDVEGKDAACAGASGFFASTSARYGVVLDAAKTFGGAATGLDGTRSCGDVRRNTRRGILLTLRTPPQQTLPHTVEIRHRVFADAGARAMN